MKTKKQNSFRFATAAQWNACLFAKADVESLEKNGGIRPFPPYARDGILYESSGAHGPVVTPEGEILWCDDECGFHRLTSCSDNALTYGAPDALASASRIVATASGLWVVNDPRNSLLRFDTETLTQLLTIEIPHSRIVDIASGERGDVLTLVRRDELFQCVRVDRAGHILETIEFKGISNARAFVFLRRLKKFVVLAGDQHQRLYWFSEDGGAANYSLAVAGLRPCFNAQVLGSDSQERVFIAGADGEEFGGRWYVLHFDASGEALGEILLDAKDAPVMGVTASREKLFVAGQRGLLQYEYIEQVPEGAGASK